jgi:hypothetical protein
LTETSARITRKGEDGEWYNFVNKCEVLPNQKAEYSLTINKTISSNILIGFCTEKGWETIIFAGMLSLRTIGAGILAICCKADLTNKLVLVLLQGRRWSAWLIWRATSCRGGRRAAKLQSAQSPPE